jgi:hypothetical protein
MTEVTLDTNVFPARSLIERAQKVGMVVAAITVSHREVEGSSLEDEVRSLAYLLETGVWDESRWDQAVWGSAEESGRLERALTLLSNGSFPTPGRREQLSAGQRRQLRDAMILCAHVRSGRHILVSRDRRGFVNDGRREAIEAEFGTRVMTVEEFEAYLAEREGHGTV